MNILNALELLISVALLISVFIWILHMIYKREALMMEYKAQATQPRKRKRKRKNEDLQDNINCLQCGTDNAVIQSVDDIFFYDTYKKEHFKKPVRYYHCHHCNRGFYNHYEYDDDKIKWVGKEIPF